MSSNYEEENAELRSLCLQAVQAVEYAGYDRLKAFFNQLMGDMERWSKQYDGQSEKSTARTIVHRQGAPTDYIPNDQLLSEMRELAKWLYQEAIAQDGWKDDPRIAETVLTMKESYDAAIRKARRAVSGSDCARRMEG